LVNCGKSDPCPGPDDQVNDRQNVFDTTVTLDDLPSFNNLDAQWFLP
jgi:hypothetical protein